jgi:predicted YcjX-like family ATPase
MMGLFGDISHEARITARSLLDAAGGLVEPNLRLGVTGLSRAGKTVFITSLVHALTVGARMPLLRAAGEGRIASARLAPQPDDAVPRFEIETHLAAFTGPERHWPESTRRISELRIVIDYQSQGFWGRQLGPSKLNLDIVDYPGEWLLDLGLMGKSYERWAAETVAQARTPSRAAIAGEWLAATAATDGRTTESEDVARRNAALFTAYLRSARDERHALSALPPGRFLMPGDLEGSPVLTFAPLDVPSDGIAPSGSLWALMARRYDAYVQHVVRPFFREHFARLDRQIVLVDALTALDAGPDAVKDLENALADVLTAFRHGGSSWLGLLRPRIDKLLFAATKADHLHHTSHDRLEAILEKLVERAAVRAGAAGTRVDVLALASVRATREGQVRRGGADYPVIIGVPQAGQQSGDEIFDGNRELAFFPGDLPADPKMALADGGFRGRLSGADADIRFLAFRPPQIEPAPWGMRLPHIRLDRALEFLIGDALE